MFTEFEIIVLEDFGDPVIFFKCFYVTKDSRTYLSIIFNKFIRFLGANYPNEEVYISKIRAGLSGYGTKEDKIVETLQNENFPIEKYVFAYWEAHFDWVEAEIERQKKWEKDNEKWDNKLQKQAAKIVEQLKPHNPIKYSEVLNELEQAVISHLVIKFPELLNAGAEDILEFEKILAKHIPELGLSIVNHVVRLRDQ